MNHTHEGFAEWQATIGRRRVRPLSELIADVDDKCRRALAAATDAREAGKTAAAERHESRAQRLLDRLNVLEERQWIAKRATSN